MTKRVKTAMPVGESGYVTPFVDGWVNWDPYEKVPDLQHPASVAVFLEMDNNDSRVSSLLEAISLPIVETGWRIDPNGADAEVVQFISRNMNLPVVGFDEVDDPGRSRGRFSWIDHLREVASPTAQFGHAVFEQVYRREADGRFVLRKLGPRPQWTIQKFNVAMDGGLDSVTQLAPASSGRTLYGPTPLDIPINRLVVYTRNKRPGYWQGRSILRSSYKHWLLKNELLRIEVVAARRNGMGVPVGTASKSNDDAEVKAMQKVASEFQGGMGSGVGLAAGQTLALLGVQGNLPDIRAAIVYHDKAIALAGLAQYMNLDTGGSYALAAVQERPFVQAENAAAKSYRDIGQAHIIEDLVDINFGVEARTPRLVFDKIGSQQDATAAALKMFVEAGLLAPDLRIERALRQSLDLPAKPDANDPDAAPPKEPDAPAVPDDAVDPSPAAQAVADVEAMREFLHPFSKSGQGRLF
ncbi:phage portal protein family protein [Mycobacteroides abscessus]|uniref:phage portal protein family protein n=1 Tax=Mycobacteroides abscessus TaxID=36809 RepID=UPI0009A72F4F|nr:hypothetical protein [Mycobacteroides abscessus]SLJ50693.1 Mu-like prophage protein gp29 [Mycobacteroides abscessus subsp. abscessus]SLJ71265.1 Mu-like prophage protein gp29 [Mycobacteroides abscessus subsp. abscessus]SLJ71908.1 Mu-like prophage protein gp29 [Mycobacteroides abscessus subsp. abscessus]SLJ74747.1 Mu-like prophage protein gp29 [Mycobacteroides abscessus subsp. abscessus]